MASSIVMKQMRGLAADIADLVPAAGQIVWDMTYNNIKFGDGVNRVSTLKPTPEIINNLTTEATKAALSAAQGKALADRITTLENKPSGSSVNVINNLTSTSTTDALSAAQGKKLNEKIDYQIDLIPKQGVAYQAKNTIAWWSRVYSYTNSSYSKSSYTLESGGSWLVIMIQFNYAYANEGYFSTPLSSDIRIVAGGSSVSIPIGTSMVCMKIM